MAGHRQLTLYHNPRCSKSRAALDLLSDRGLDFAVVEYLREPPDAATLRAIIAGSDASPVEFVRTGDAAFKDARLELAEDAKVDTVVSLLVEHPMLLQRPILVAGERSVIGRPPESILELLERS